MLVILRGMYSTCNKDQIPMLYSFKKIGDVKTWEHIVGNLTSWEQKICFFKLTHSVIYGPHVIFCLCLLPSESGCRISTKHTLSNSIMYRRNLNPRISWKINVHHYVSTNSQICGRKGSSYAQGHNLVWASSLPPRRSRWGDTGGEPDLAAARPTPHPSRPRRYLRKPAGNPAVLSRMAAARCFSSGVHLLRVLRATESGFQGHPASFEVGRQLSSGSTVRSCGAPLRLVSRVGLLRLIGGWLAGQARSGPQRAGLHGSASEDPWLHWCGCLE
jgi:hypothetical protein